MEVVITAATRTTSHPPYFSGDLKSAGNTNAPAEPWTRCASEVPQQLRCAAAAALADAINQMRSWLLTYLIDLWSPGVTCAMPWGHEHSERNTRWIGAVLLLN